MYFFWLIIRIIVLPLAAYYVLRGTVLGEAGSILAIGVALLIAAVLSIIWSIFKILGNTLLLRGREIVKIVLGIILQVAVLVFVWAYYFINYTNYI